MADYNQQNQRVDRQNNAGRDVNAQHYTSQDRHDQHIQYQEHIGRDKIHVHHNTPSTSSVLARGAIIVVVLLLLGAGVYFSYPSLKSIANNLSNGNLFNTSNGLDRMLYGTPKGSLDQFCSNLKAGDIQGAYDDYSDHLKSQISPNDFANTWSQPGEGITICIDNIINTSGTSATGTLDITTRTIANTGVTDNHIVYNVTMVSSDGIWKIDALTKQ